MNFGLSDTVIKKFKTVFSKHPQVEEVLIYGSRAKNTFREGSDIDLTLKGTAIDQTILTQIWLDLDALNTPYLIDLSIYNSLTSTNLLEHIDRIGKTFYSKQESILVE